MKSVPRRLRQAAGAAGLFLVLGLLLGGCSGAAGHRERPAPPLPLPASPAATGPEDRRPPAASEAQSRGSAAVLPAPPPQEVSGIPVLMYHEVGEGPNELFVSEANFRAQLDLLQRAGFQTVTLDWLIKGFEGKAPLPKRPVVLTFDDGYASHYRTVFPLLHERGFGGVFFVYTAGVGAYNRVTWDQLREMQAQGMEVEAHSVSHTDLTLLSRRPERLREETAGAREVLERELGKEVRYFCYPAGRYDARAVKAVRDAGYRAAFTTKPGLAAPAQSRYELRRVRVNRSDSLERFAVKLGLSKGSDGEV